jgi:hypothetical protein
LTWSSGGENREKSGKTEKKIETGEGTEAEVEAEVEADLGEIKIKEEIDM